MIRRTLLLTTALLLVSAARLAAHDLYIKLDTFFAFPGDTLRVPLLNGTFTRSENSVTRDRVSNLSVVGPDGVTQPPPNMEWNSAGDTTVFRVPTRKSGTYVIGLSTMPREIKLAGGAFNSYLREEGIDNILARRTARGELGRAARERYSKNAKAIVQIGDDRSDGYKTPLGYPAEIVALDNPYEGQRSGKLRVQCLVDREPAAGLQVIVGSQRAGQKPIETRLRTDKQGIATIPLNRSGRWYVRFVKMVPASGSGVDYESKWATLTFQIGHAP
ncbi:MAG TPA: DUF4198 domain-containing protein [Gemmatimonadaceae bacterium]|nr:DUF4198 domain-containing protein [Gemmatimonadaceae bacterium]